jgi:L-lactate dehydrogenase complex protein LldG
MSARDRIFARLRAVPATTTTSPNVNDWYVAHARREPNSQRIARFREALLAAHAEVHETTNNDWASLLFRIAAAKGLQCLLFGSNTPHGAALEARRVENLQLVRYDQPVERWRDQLFDGIDASLTLAKSAIAETGSLILWPNQEEPRLMSLVPPVHFVQLDAENIHADFHTAMCSEGWKDALPSNALLISGPSKTADIQQTLAYGAHGPRELIVLLRHAQRSAA